MSSAGHEHCLPCSSTPPHDEEKLPGPCSPWTKAGGGGGGEKKAAQKVEEQDAPWRTKDKFPCRKKVRSLVLKTWARRDEKFSGVGWGRGTDDPVGPNLLPSNSYDKLTVDFRFAESVVQPARAVTILAT